MIMSSPAPQLCPLLLAAEITCPAPLPTGSANCARERCAWWVATHDPKTGKTIFAGCTIPVAGAMLVQITSLLAAQVQAPPPPTIVKPS
jgi:hypothetical protein